MGNCHESTKTQKKYWCLCVLVVRFLVPSETGFIADEACFISVKIGRAAAVILAVFICVNLRSSADKKS